MKITLNQDPAFQETEIIINCPQADEDILRLVAMLRIHQHKLVGLWQGESHLLDIRDILYIDTADKRTFLYTREKVYESALRLYELEDSLMGLDFLRISRSAKMCIRDSHCPYQGHEPAAGYPFLHQGLRGRYHQRAGVPGEAAPGGRAGCG